MARRGRRQSYALFRAAASQLSAPSMGISLNPEWACARSNPVGRAIVLLRDTDAGLDDGPAWDPGASTDSLQPKSVDSSPVANRIAATLTRGSTQCSQ